MARKPDRDLGGKARLLRALAYEIHRKTSAEDALTTHIEEQYRLGRHREWRPVADTLAEQGFAAALAGMGLLSPDAAVVLATVVEARDHRMLSSALNALADHLDEGNG